MCVLGDVGLGLGGSLEVLMTTPQREPAVQESRVLRRGHLDHQAEIWQLLHLVLWPVRVLSVHRESQSFRDPELPSHLKI